MSIAPLIAKLQVLRTTLIPGIQEELAKWERHGSTQMVNREAHYQALTAVKDHVLKWASKLVDGMQNDEVKHVPVAGCELTVRKIMSDMYTGTVRKGTELIHTFDRITVPQLAGQLQSLLELYDPDKVQDESKTPNTMIVDKLKPLAENVENGMVSQLLAIISGGDPRQPAAAPEKTPEQEINDIIKEANDIADEARNRMASVDPRKEVQDLKERVEQMLQRVEGMLSTPSSQDDDKFHGTLHEMQAKHDILVDRVQQELNILHERIKQATTKLDSYKPAGKTITITVN